MTADRVAAIITDRLDGTFLDDEGIWLSARVDGKGIRVMVQEMDEDGDAGEPTVYEITVR